MKRSFEEISLRVRSLFHGKDRDLVRECVSIAAEKAPSSAFDLGTRAAMLAGVDEFRARGVAKATRWLAVIRRDYGIEKFNQLTGTLAKEET